MTQSLKLQTYKQHMSSRGVSPSAAFPPLWRVLWACGIAVPPPPFLGFFSLTLLSGCWFGPVFALGAWLLGNRGPKFMSVEAALWVALVTGLFFGLVMAVYYRSLARKHGLGSWAAFPALSRPS